MRKKSMLVLLMLAVLLSSILGTNVANAALKETLLSSELVTESGIFNRLDWEKVGENVDTVYTENVQGNILRWKDVVWTTGWLVAWDPVDFANGDVYMEFDIMNWGASNAFRPVFTPTGSGITSTYRSLWFNGTVIDASAYEGEKDYDYYSDVDCTTLYTETHNDVNVSQKNGNAFFYLTPTPLHIRMIFRENGTLGIQKAVINDDGSYADFAVTSSLFIKNALPGLSTETQYYVGINGWGNIDFDNFKISYADGTEVISTGFENADWQEVEGINRPGKILNFNGRMTKVAEYAVTNPADSNYTISKSAIEVNEDVNESFSFTSEIAIRELTNKKIGFAFGLADGTQAVNAEGTSFVYFENVEVPAVGTEGEEGYVAAHIETAVNIMKDGVSGDAVLIGKNLVSADAAFTPVAITGYRNGDLKVSVSGKEATFVDQHIAGKVAIASYGVGTVTAAFGIELDFVNYAYRGSAGSVIANNFNTGYLNPENWAIQSISAVMFEYLDEAVGLVVEDGSLFFKGTGDHTFFASTQAYADYVLEFDYITYHNDDKPALQSTWVHGYSDLSVNLGCNSGDGWGTSIMIMLKQE